MKKVLIFSICFPMIAFSNSGRLFNVSYQAQSGLINITLKTTIPNRSYMHAGMTIPGGYSFANGSCPNQQGQTCLFSINNSSSVNIQISGPPGIVTNKLCLNQPQQLNCENSSIQYFTTALVMGGEANGVIYSTQNNINWTTYTTGFTENQFKGSYCTNDGSQCVAAGFQGTSNSNFVPAAFISTDYGATWTTANTSSTTSGLVNANPIQFWDISCIEQTGFCVAGGNASPGSNKSYVWYSQNFGASWSIAYQQPASNNYITAGASCYHSTASNQDKCVVLGRVNGDTGATTGVGIAGSIPMSFTTNNTILPPAGYNNFVALSLSCASSDRCVAGGFSSNQNGQIPVLYYSTDGGHNWVNSSISSIGPSSTAVGQASKVSCDATGLRCIAGGWYASSASSNDANGVVYVSSDGGATWDKTVILPSPRVDLTTIRLNAAKCSPFGTCYVAGHAENTTNASYPISYVSYDYGQTWSAGSLLPFPGTTDRENLFTISLFESLQVL